NYPIRIQSMTISDTMDTAATVAETIQLVEAGCEIVRITAPSLNEAENLRHIKAELHRCGIRVPLVADIHFTPNAALKAAEYVEKVRINPGNYADKKKFATREYSDNEYQAELERIEERFKPLVLKLKQYGVAIGIGSLLEDGIGDTIRVSLTEDSVHEIPAAYAIARPYNARLAAPDQATLLPVRVSTRTVPLPQESRNPYGYRRRPSDEVRLGDLQVGGAQPVRVELATTVPLADVDGTLAQIPALSTPAHPGAP